MHTVEVEPEGVCTSTVIRIRRCEVDRALELELKRSNRPSMSAVVPSGARFLRGGAGASSVAGTSGTAQPLGRRPTMPKGS